MSTPPLATPPSSDTDTRNTTCQGRCKEREFRERKRELMEREKRRTEREGGREGVVCRVRVVECEVWGAGCMHRVQGVRCRVHLAPLERARNKLERAVRRHAWRNIKQRGVARVIHQVKRDGLRRLVRRARKPGGPHAGAGEPRHRLRVGDRLLLERVVGVEDEGGGVVDWDHDDCQERGEGGVRRECVRLLLSV